MQRDGRLPGSRAALDEQEPGQGRPDDLVLFALDRAHDVGHPAGAHGAERSEESARTAEGEGTLEQLTAGPIAVGIGRVRRPPRHGDAEVLVLVPDDGPRANGQVAPAGQALGVEPGGPIEGGGDGGAPVHHQGLAVEPGHG